MAEVTTQVWGALAVALVGAIGAIYAARVGRETKAARADVARKVGEPNGRGTVVKMLEDLLDGQERHGDRLTRIEERAARMEARQVDHHERLTRIEATVTD